MNWQKTVIDRLLRGARPNGAWGYRPENDGFAEPTAMVCLAINAHHTQSQRMTDSLSWLAKIQRADGGVPICEFMTSPCWTTPLAILAWSATSEKTGTIFEGESRRATEWLTRTEGHPIPRDPVFFGHDTMLVGWPWNEGAHSWIEPTSFAVLALRTVGYGEHERVKEGIRVIEDRALPDGGWNYGNTRVLVNTLRPFSATTGITLAALAGNPVSARIDHAISYLTKQLRQIRSPHSLGWGLIGLSAWNARPAEADQWLEESAKRYLPKTPNALNDAILLLADAEWHPVVHRETKDSAHRDS